MKIIILAKYFFCALLLWGSLFSCAQTNTIVKKVYSFYTEHTPGNIAVDQNGNELTARLDTAIQVYVEASVKNITWDTAWLNNKSYLIITQLVTQDSIDAGIKKDESTRAVIRVKKGYYLWQLYLQPLFKTENNKYKKMKVENEILLKGKYKGMIFLQKAGKPVQLETIPSV
jgi:hypothetical protein